MGTNFTSESAARIVDVVKQVEANPLGENPPMPSASVIAEAYAKITVETGSGVYEAKEQVFDGTAFIDLTNGRLWDGSPIPKIFESSLVTGIAVDTIVKLTLVGNNSGEATWIFTSSSSTVFNHPWKSRLKAGTDDTIEIGFNRSAFLEDSIVYSEFTIRKDTVEEFVIAASGSQTVYAFIKHVETGGADAITLSYFNGSIAEQFQGTTDVLGSRLDITPWFRVPIGTLQNANTASAVWQQQIFTNITLPSINVNIFYDEISEEVFSSWANPNGGGIPGSPISIPQNQISHVFLVGDSGSKFWNGMEVTTGSSPATFGSYKICVLRTDATGKLLWIQKVSTAFYQDTDT